MLDALEEAGGVRWQFRTDGTAVVYAAGGFELATLPGPAGCYQDTGQEGLVRLTLESEGHRCWTQPRLVGRQGGLS